MDKQVFTPVENGGPARTEDAPRSVIVELIPTGGARLRKAPPDTMVMVVESQRITASGRRSVAAGGRGPDLDAHIGHCNDRDVPRQIAVSFPG